jgi:hypothetical protein
MRCEAPISDDTTGHVKIAISMVLVDAGNSKTAVRLDGQKVTAEGGILDAMKTLLHGMLCGLDSGIFPVQTRSP